MSNAIRKSLAVAGFSAALALAGVPAARGQVFFQGNFPVPHGQISIGVGAPGFPIGGYVPAPYLDEIVYVPGYGYGFYCDQGFVPVRSYGGRWIVAHRAYRIDRYDRYNRYDRYDRYNRYDRRFDHRRFDRDDRFDRRDFRRGDGDRDDRRW